jgi:hypothetical protein
MKYIIDTSVWSVAFRKSPKNNEETALIELARNIIREMKVVMIGPIRQELLSGISDKSKFEQLLQRMSVFTDRIIQTEEYELAAEYSNECRKNGIQGSHIDFLICAVATTNDAVIVTLDKDFEKYPKYIPIKLYRK